MMRNMILTAAAVLVLSACAGTPPHLSDTMNGTDLDRLKAAHWYAYHGTLSQRAVWANPFTGLAGTVRALEEYRDPTTGQTCRKLVESTRSTAGARDIRIGTACEKTDGDLLVTYSDRADTEGDE